MNKGITIFILVVLLCAMGMVFYSHIRDSDPDPAGPRYAAGDAPRFEELSPNNALNEDSASSANEAGSPPPFDRNDKAPVEAPQTAAPAELQGQNASIPIPAGPAGAAPTQEARGKTNGQPQAGASGDGALTGKTEQPVQTAGKTETEKATTSAKPAGPADGEKRESPANAGKQSEKQADAGSITSGQSSGRAASGASSTPLSGTHTLKNIGVHFSGQNMMLRLESDSVFPIKHFVLTKPDRLVIDLPGNWKNMRVPTVPQNNIIKAVRLGSQPGGPRLVLDLAKAPSHQEVVKVSDTVVEVLVR